MKAKHFRSIWVYIILLVGALVVIGTFAWTYLLSAPQEFGEDRIIEIPQDHGSYAIAKKLKEERIVRSSTLLHVAIVLFGGEKKVQAGDYLFDEPVPVWTIASRLTHGVYGFAPRRITFPEGFSVADIADALSKELINFSTSTFIELAQDKEGYLFPDTYLFRPTARPDEALALLETTFERRIEEIKSEIAAFNKPLNDIVTMASIVEEEANDEKSRRIVAGILWRRLEAGMPLQVDATFRYINGKTSAELTKDDLKIDSPYNTYVYKGLPPTPISNPGMQSLRATVTPIDTPYIYFLTGDDGEMYYAKTLAEHNQNKTKYLKDID
jgi:UPF0755 protein